MVDDVPYQVRVKNRPDGSSDTVTSTLDAFLSCPEEDVESVLHDCLALTAADTRFILAASSVTAGLDDANVITHGVPASEKERGSNEKYVASSRELRYRDVLRAWDALANKTRFTSGAIDVKGVVAGCCGALSKVRLDAQPQDGDVELLDLCDVQEIRMGSLVSMLRDGAPVADTAFDNFVDDGGDGAASTMRDTQQAGAVQRAVIAPPRPIPDLDDFLAVDGCSSDGGEGGCGDSSGGGSSQKPSAIGNVSIERSEEEGHSGKSLPTLSARISSSGSSYSSLSLPGLEVCGRATDARPSHQAAVQTVHDTDTDNTVRTDKAFAQNMYAALQGVRHEADDDVHDFALDPLFDYDEDVAGSALREHGFTKRV